MDDLEAIKQLKARCCRLLDTKGWAGYRQVRTDDVTMDGTESGGGVVTGADERLTFLVAATPAAPGNPAARHQGDG